MSNNTVCGSIVFVDETRTYGSNGFQKRLVVLTQNRGKYDNYIPVEFLGDMCGRADCLSLGGEVTVEYKINGRKWTSPETGEDKYFVNLEVVNLEVAGVVDHEGDHLMAESMSNEPNSSTDDEIPF